MSVPKNSSKNLLEAALEALDNGVGQLGGVSGRSGEGEIIQAAGTLSALCLARTQIPASTWHLPPPGAKCQEGKFI